MEAHSPHLPFLPQVLTSGLTVNTRTQGQGEHKSLSQPTGVRIRAGPQSLCLEVGVGEECIVCSLSVWHAGVYMHIHRYSCRSVFSVWELAQECKASSKHWPDAHTSDTIGLVWHFTLANAQGRVKY